MEQIGIAAENGELESEDEEELKYHETFFEDLVERQAVLTSDVSLRQNPHNVTEWMKRIELFSSNPRLVDYSFFL